MSRICICDVCKQQIDKVIAITDRQGELYIPIEGSNLDINITLEITSPTEYDDICFSCVVANMLKTITKRREGVEQLNAVKK